jgi:hypothetical protein
MRPFGQMPHGSLRFLMRILKARSLGGSWWVVLRRHFALRGPSVILVSRSITVAQFNWSSNTLTALYRDGLPHSDSLCSPPLPCALFCAIGLSLKKALESLLRLLSAVFRATLLFPLFPLCAEKHEHLCNRFGCKVGSDLQQKGLVLAQKATSVYFTSSSCIEEVFTFFFRERMNPPPLMNALTNSSSSQTPLLSRFRQRTSSLPQIPVSFVRHVPSFLSVPSLHVSPTLFSLWALSLSL